MAEDELQPSELGTKE